MLLVFFPPVYTNDNKSWYGSSIVVMHKNVQICFKIFNRLPQSGVGTW